MVLCTKKRIYVVFLIITILQIVFTGFRQIFDFLGPLWALILTNFFNIVFSIFGFFGGYTQRLHFLIMYIFWSLIWAVWNAFIICLYIPVSNLESLKSSILSIGTGGFSWWETRAPGCIPDWASETTLVVTNCYFDPKVVECVQAGIQVYLAILGIVTALSIALCPKPDFDEKYSDGRSIRSSSDTYDTAKPNRTVPAFLSLSRSGTGGGISSNNNSISRHSNRSSNRTRGPLNLPGNHVNGDTVGTIDDRLRPMTPRKVKRRSARSIQSQRYGPGQSQIGDNNPGSSSSNPHQSPGNRNSLRSSTNSRRSTANHRNSKRKSNTNHNNQQFISPVNRLMQQQIDSETSHDEPRRYSRRDQGHINPVYIGPQSPASSTVTTNTNPNNPPAPPRPPSARSSYSNYHPARLPINSGHPNPNVFNLNQNLFTTQGYDNTAEYNNSLLSGNTNGGYYDDEVVVPYHPMSTIHPHNSIPPVPMPRPQASNNTTNTFMQTSSPIPHHQNPFHELRGRRNENHMQYTTGSSNTPTLVYPLAHSPVSQESFPMWGVAQAQVPTSPLQSPSSSSTGYHNNPTLSHPNRPFTNSNRLQLQPQPLDSETVI